MHFTASQHHANQEMCFFQREHTWRWSTGRLCSHVIKSNNGPSEFASNVPCRGQTGRPDIMAQSSGVRVQCVPCYHGVARPHIADGTDGLTHFHFTLSPSLTYLLMQLMRFRWNAVMYVNWAPRGTVRASGRVHRRTSGVGFMRGTLGWCIATSLIECWTICWDFPTTFWVI
jgi:hypothetical protein